MNPLSRFTNEELEARLKDLVQKERKLLHVIIEHIREIDGRRIYLTKGYSSIYDYLTKELGYSGSAAMRRLEAARLLREVPQVAEHLQEGTLNLSQIGELSRAIKEKEKLSGEKVSSFQKQDLVAAVFGKTAQETQYEVARIFDLPLKDYDTQRLQKDESVRLEFTLTKEQHEKLLRCKDLAAHILLQGNGSVSLNEVIEFLADQYLDEKFKKPKSSRIPQQKSLHEEIKKSVRPSAQKLMSNPAIITTDSVVERKSITPKMRKLILARDKCCQYVNKDTGAKCHSTFALQIDHKTSKWAGGMNTIDNLQLLCSQHNRMKYKREAGIESR
ncbi:HNH endonuclease [Bdellovibrio reynosensis]|uniref:HNH endonuclease n=1 Tax=Bdellovibrio reynosensis TaxID=2835041 RepID=A0ABY4CB35_9BACT|nr:HNH endonuclease signature motif containing protein [Bdellovibrio reynosensis]UOF02058.1 HNH endonuclease [Bdellovibrio reynosensis]